MMIFHPVLHSKYFLFILFIYLFIVSLDELAFQLTALPLSPVCTI